MPDLTRESFSNDHKCQNCSQRGTEHWSNSCATYHRENALLGQLNLPFQEYTICYSQSSRRPLSFLRCRICFQFCAMEFLSAYSSGEQSTKTFSNTPFAAHLFLFSRCLMVSPLIKANDVPVGRTKQNRQQKLDCEFQQQRIKSLLQRKRTPEDLY